MGSCCRTFVVNSALLALSCVFQVLGLATTGWIVLRDDRSGLYIGLGIWNVYVCHRESCTYQHVDLVKNVLYDSDEDKIGFLEQQIETTLALVAMLIGLVLCILACCHRDSVKTKILKRFAVLAIVLSGLLALTAVARMIYRVMKLKDQLKEGGSSESSSSPSPFGFPYSLLFMCVGGFLAIGAALAIGCDDCGASRNKLLSEEENPQYLRMEAPHGMWQSDRDRLN